jgi:hypothetical protein
VFGEEAPERGERPQARGWQGAADQVDDYVNLFELFVASALLNVSQVSTVA